jgi:hypothetical protein
MPWNECFLATADTPLPQLGLRGEQTGPTKDFQGRTRSLIFAEEEQAWRPPFSSARLVRAGPHWRANPAKNFE